MLRPAVMPIRVELFRFDTRLFRGGLQAVAEKKRAYAESVAGAVDYAQSMTSAYRKRVKAEKIRKS